MRIFNTVYKVCLKREFLGSNNLKMMFISCAWSYVQNLRKILELFGVSVVSACVCVGLRMHVCISVCFLCTRVCSLFKWVYVDLYV